MNLTNFRDVKEQINLLTKDKNKKKTKLVYFRWIKNIFKVNNVDKKRIHIFGNEINVPLP